MNGETLLWEDKSSTNTVLCYARAEGQVLDCGSARLTTGHVGRVAGLKRKPYAPGFAASEALTNVTTRCGNGMLRPAASIAGLSCALMVQ